MSKDMDKHLIPMGNGASQCKYCGASFLPSYTEQSTEPVKNTGQNPVNAEPGVDEELIEMLDEAQGLCLQEEYSINEKIAVRGRFDKIKQLLTHISTSGNDMSDKRTVTRGWLEETARRMVTRFDGECGLSELQSIGIIHVLTEKGDLEDVFEELGIEGNTANEQ